LRSFLICSFNATFTGEPIAGKIAAAKSLLHSFSRIQSGKLNETSERKIEEERASERAIGAELRNIAREEDAERGRCQCH